MGTQQGGGRWWVSDKANAAALTYSMSLAVLRTAGHRVHGCICMVFHPPADFPDPLSHDTTHIDCVSWPC
jgi:hypothetical protein